MEKVVAIVGRPNVGKSTLFNRMIGKRIAIVHSESGVTRDRNFGEADWTGKKFFLIDTGGYVPDSAEQFESNIRAQVKIAIEESDKVIFVVDAIDGLIPVDFEIAKLLRERSGNKKIFLVTNKADNDKRDLNTTDFFKLGLGEPHCVSALSGRNVADLLDLITEDFELSEEKEEDDRIKFAIIGRPNAGKSSIINAILKEERNIVTDIPGTTRDSIDSTLKYFGEEIVLIDTAGLTKASKIKKSGAVDFFSTVRTFKAIQRCNVAILVVDVTLLFENFINAPDMKLAQFKVDKQDARIIEDVANYKKGILVVINKWDLVEKDTQTAKILTEKIKEHLRTFGFLKMIYISALTKQRIHKVIEEAKVVYEERKKIIKTSVLNDTMQEEIRSKPPASSRGREVKINYITQLKAAPPVFAFFVNEPKLINENYKRFLENKMRQHFGFEGVPLTLVFKKKN